ncbi:PREDICTED: probable calcium-binding protein CML35 [Tarenaya hassleriana]|uniref:probable calcium-binding protein CML35 n=1 Tax=Tarenaya hassleriana TaxID=28532 RepID=UPI00053C892F|nr:PREDICTED: probable calcium-binding protein CML35 [Tarenaya hassleriana]
MKLVTISSKFLRLSPKRLFRSKDRSSIFRSNPSSFSSSISSDGSYSGAADHKPGPAATPISVLPEISGDWSQVSAGDSDLYSELVQAFKLIDRDDDGAVSRSELAALLTRLSPEPPSQDEVSMMLREADGGVAGTSAAGSVEAEELREVFEFFDADRDGRISAEELLRVFGVIGDDRCTLEECLRMIATVDVNGDGFVCFEDFSRMMELQR